MSPETEARDPRIDRVMTWLLTTAWSLALVIASFFLTSIKAKVDEIALKLEAIASRVSVIEAGKVGERCDRLEARVRELEIASARSRSP